MRMLWMWAYSFETLAVELPTTFRWSCDSPTGVLMVVDVDADDTGWDGTVVAVFAVVDRGRLLFIADFIAIICTFDGLEVVDCRPIFCTCDSVDGRGAVFDALRSS